VNRDDVHRLAREIEERELEPAEFELQVEAALADERSFADRVELVRWFSRRYPTPAERLAYARQKLLEIRESPLRLEPRD
jgi:hypothetical protein